MPGCSIQQGASISARSPIVVSPVRQPRHHSCQLRFLGEPINVVAGEIWVNCEKVVPDGSVAKRELLKYHGGVAAQLAYRRRNVAEED